MKLIAEFETKAAWSSMTKEDWAQHEIAFHEIPMKDFVGSSSRPEIQRAVQFINNIAKQGKSVFVDICCLFAVLAIKFSGYALIVSWYGDE